MLCAAAGGVAGGGCGREPEAAVAARRDSAARGEDRAGGAVVAGERGQVGARGQQQQHTSALRVREPEPRGRHGARQARCGVRPRRAQRRPQVAAGPCARRVPTFPPGSERSAIGAVSRCSGFVWARMMCQQCDACCHRRTPAAS
eukprot:1233736-Rhodomonas_salina.4